MYILITYNISNYTVMITIFLGRKLGILWGSFYPSNTLDRTLTMLGRLTSLYPTCNKTLLDSFKQRFGPLSSVYYVLCVSSISLEQVLCTLICKGKSISKNPPSTTAIAVSKVNSLIATTSRKRPLKKKKTFCFSVNTVFSNSLVSDPH